MVTPFFLLDILKELGYVEHSFVNWYWCLPESSVAECLLPIRFDANIIRMDNISSQHKNLRIYIDHSNFIERQRRQTCLIVAHLLNFLQLLARRR
jgi:hypothetical protein